MDMILCIGVDVSSRTFKASLGAEAAKGAQFPDDEAGRLCRMVRRRARERARRLRGDGRLRGGLYRLPRRPGRRVHRATPYLVKSYIRSLGLKAKTDRIDARALARYGAERGADLAPIARRPKANASSPPR